VHRDAVSGVRRARLDAPARQRDQEAGDDQASPWAATQRGTTGVREQGHGGNSIRGWRNATHGEEQQAWAARPAFDSRAGRYHQQSFRVIKLYQGRNFGYQAGARRHALAVFGADTAN
jgi:hypothetical protein